MIDLSNLTPSESFRALCAHLARAYPFTAWKGIDWNALSARWMPRLARAEAEQSADQYYLALREFVYAIPDARLQLWGDDGGLQRACIGGSFGFVLARLDDGRVVVSFVREASSAARAGIRVGTSVLAWNDLPIDDAIAQTPVIWAERPPATRAIREIQQRRLLTRAPSGTIARITCADASVELVAEDDRMELWYQSALVALPPPSDAVFGKVMPSGVGLITLGALSRHASRRVLDRTQALLRDFIRQRVIGIVLDLRQCDDGDNALAAAVASFFHPKPIFFAALAKWDSATRTFTFDLHDSQTPLRTQHASSVCYTGPVVALIGPRTSGAAEGLARAIQRAPNGMLIGLGATGGSFSGARDLPMGEAQLPGGYVITFPTTGGLNQDGVVWIEGNRFGEGGVTPNVRVPLNDDTFVQTFVEGRDLELTYAVYTLTNRARDAQRATPVETRRVVSSPARQRRLAWIPRWVPLPI